MIESIMWIVFVLACLIVSAVILLQEGKGGGLGEAFGGVGQQTFGVKAEGINFFTGWVSLLVVVLAIAITKYRGGSSAVAFPEATPPLSIPASDGSTPSAPGNAPGTTPPGDGSAPAPGDGASQPPTPPAGDNAPPSAPQEPAPVPQNGDK
jgi:preprotein translocase subunit SecG